MLMMTVVKSNLPLVRIVQFSIRGFAPTDQGDQKVRSGELLPLVSTAGETHQTAKDAQASRHRDVDQPPEDRLATLLIA
ncbi:hypothetical protein OAL34_02735 [Synechococcus sp. AH-551-G03]|nr:hypothetical protein [Synechococcus sp. AH-551-G03]